MKVRHTAAWVVFTAAALVATTACGAGVAKETADKAAEAVSASDRIMAALARATDRTEELGSAEVRTTTDLGNGAAPIAMEGTYSWGDGLAYDAQMDTSAAQMQTLTDDPTIRVLLVDGSYFYDIDPQPSGPLAGKEWMRVDTSAVFGEEGASALDGPGSGSPTASLKTLKYANDVENLGKETVNGQTTTHYRAVIDQAHMGKYKDAFGSKDNLFGSMTGGADSITTEIWVNSRDLPVRLAQEFGSMKVTMDFEKFGRTADIEAPPAAQTGDMTEQLKKLNKQ